MSFSQRVETFSHDYLKCCAYIRDFGAGEDIFTKMLFSKLSASSQLLEDFLDVHGAKNNRDWFYYRELAAAVRHLSLGGYAQKHILNRLHFYELEDDVEFEKDSRKTRNFFTRTLRQIAPAVLEEAAALQIPAPADTFSEADFPPVMSDSEMLADNVDSGMEKQRGKDLVKIAGEFLNIARHFDELEFYEPFDLQKIMSIVPDRVNEVEIRTFEMRTHNLQSSFDTYVALGGLKTGAKNLRKLRGTFSVALHLLEIMGRLLHFYERHLSKDVYKDVFKKARRRLKDLASAETLLDRTINYGLYYVCYFLSSGKNPAKAILNENIERSSIEVGVPVNLGFHSRPSLLVARIVRHYGGEVTLCAGERRFDAGSVLDIQWAGGLIRKENIDRVIFEGDARALHDIEILAGVNYGEDTFGKGVPLPRELEYLR
ncbi:Phosphotransferase [Candidatus Desulfarcum epimagneticum]|uniref:Phosphotransferase n=1 Tax=uncultured Desulfobacteraceae bacterium TaxID=218296 RepID=A0A484HPU2_9BACT|nr:Phosphotransferase [uncultured Desulfobacteraceae bacterium]